MRFHTYGLLFLMMVFLNFACAHHPENFYFGDYSEAERFYNKGDYAKAIEKYQAYRNENPEGNLALISLYYMAKSHAELGHQAEAKALFEQIVKEYPGMVWANFAESQLKELEGGKKVPDSASPEKTATSQ